MGDRLRKVSGRGYTFWDRVDFSGDCWEWLSSKNHNGYGRLYFNGKSWKATAEGWVRDFEDVSL